MITLLSGLALIPAAWLLAPEQPLVTALTVTSGHFISGFLFSCDLDIDSTEYRRWGPLRILWWPYKEAVPHRSWISHGLVVGPLLRLAYFTFLVYALMWIVFGVLDRSAQLQTLVQQFTTSLHDHPGIVYGFLIGFVLGGAAHSIPDWITTGTKRTITEWTRL